MNEIPGKISIRVAFAGVEQPVAFAKQMQQVVQ
jgi:hypothetical protein